MATDQLVLDVTFESDVVLAGSLTLPNGAAGAPAVVMVGGSGPADRDNDTHFPPITRHLTRAGITVLSYDKRGVGGSSGDWRDGTLDDLATDAIAALDFLRAQPGVRTAGLLGHSEGGWVVLRAATRTNVPWVVTNGTPGTTPAAQDRHAVAAAVDSTFLDEALATHDRLVDAGRRDATFAEATEVVTGKRMPPGFTEYWSEMDERSWGFLKRKQDHDPIPDTLRLRCPHLAIFGGADRLVPVPESVNLLSQAACHPDRHHQATLTVEIFPHANHRVLIDDDPAPGYLDTLTRWITSHS
jgi:uncharacterized protein